MEGIKSTFNDRSKVLRVEPLEEEFEGAACDEATQNTLQYVEQLHDVLPTVVHRLQLVGRYAEKGMDLGHKLVQVRSEVPDEIFIDPE